ncbi:hypothetical protein HELRODRAFT_191370 [Helobdella robusta]|uniref:RRM domain-containing protein n=1 Tax=Helobdella robusta TaxID=6412 RepID=T1FSX5_HELRO|nr:hypothetical protein HELRODRAFT_191370 [Helobdella robusta]ESO05736.1 hypothetical protein HELRODRAFT_191370 [Helobdella robusta]
MSSADNEKSSVNKYKSGGYGSYSRGSSSNSHSSGFVKRERAESHNRSEQKGDVDEAKKSGSNNADSSAPKPKTQEKKFTGRCRIFVGNVPNDMTEDEFKKMFEAHGETSELFLNANRGFGFIRMETRHITEKARAALDGQVVKGGRHLRVRLAGHPAALKVKYLSPNISNELLEQTFSMFGEVERAVVIVDDKGKPTGEGIVEFSRKAAAASAVKKISEGIFLMTAQPRPIEVEFLEQKDENDGLPELFFTKTSELLKDREKPPRFVQPGSFESDIGQKWKKLYQLYRDQEELLKKNFADEVAKLEVDQETAMLEQHTNMLRQDLQRRQEELRLLEEQTQNEIKRKLEMRNVYQNRRQEDERRRGPLMDNDLRRRQDDVLRRQMDAVKNQSSDNPFNLDRGLERPSAGAPPLQPPPVPPNVDRTRLQTGVGLLGSALGVAQSLGNFNNGGNVRVGMLARPPLQNNVPLLMDPTGPQMRPPQNMRFDNPPPVSSNMLGLRPPGGMGQHGPMLPNQGSVSHSEAKRPRRY